MKKDDYCQCVQVGRGLNEVFVLPCVRSVCKDGRDGDERWLFMIRTADDLVRSAEIGDWLCERRDGKGWDILSPMAYVLLR